MDLFFITRDHLIYVLILGYKLLSIYKTAKTSINQFSQMELAWYICFNNIFFDSTVKNSLGTSASVYFEKYWCKTASQLNIPRTNILAERCMKKIEELRNRSRSVMNLNAKFIDSNDL